jgi:hypothetical protein
MQHARTQADSTFLGFVVVHLYDYSEPPPLPDLRIVQWLTGSAPEMDSLHKLWWC